MSGRVIDKYCSAPTVLREIVRSDIEIPSSGAAADMGEEMGFAKTPLNFTFYQKHTQRNISAIG